MIDLHCHLLPSVDDGARSMQDALALAAASAGNGITHAVLTPHIHPGCFDNRLSGLRPVFEQFRSALRLAGISLDVSLGAEVRLHPEALDLLEAGELPHIGMLDGDRVVLLEFPDGQIPVGAASACNYLARRGVRVLIAHPERNKEVMREPSRIQPFVDAGCLLQLTAASVIGRFGANALDASHHLLAKGLVAVVATDAHNLAHRPPLLREARRAISDLYGIGTAHRLTEELPAAIIGRKATDV